MKTCRVPKGLPGDLSFQQPFQSQICPTKSRRLQILKQLHLQSYSPPYHQEVEAVMKGMAIPTETSVRPMKLRMRTPKTDHHPSDKYGHMFIFLYTFSR